MDKALKNNFVLKVGIYLGTSIEEIDTLNITTGTEATIIRNLYSPLVDYDHNAQLVTGIAKTFYWENNNLIFEFSDKVKLNSGRYIDAYDAYYSIKRLIKDGKNLHGDIRLLLCNGKKINTIDEECPGLKVKDGKLIFTLEKEEYKELILPLLASVDFRIIPRECFDHATLKIIDFSNTTGPFYLEKSGQLKLKANINHYFYSEKIPQEIQLINFNSKDIVEKFISEEIDLIPTVTTLSQSGFDKIQASTSNFDLFSTYPIKIRLVRFSKKAINTYSSIERFSIGKKIEADLFDSKILFEQPTSQFFQSFGQGYLDENQIKEVEALKKKSFNQKLSKRPTLGVAKNNIKDWDRFFKNNPEFDPMPTEKSPSSLDVNDRPDSFLAMTDVAFNSGVPLLSYNLKQGTFGLFGNEAEIWLKDFIETSNQSEKLNKLNQLHYNAIRNCTIYPISSAPYVAIVRKPWKINFNKFFQASNFWQITKEE